MDSQNLKEKQKNIYDGLRTVGEEIASFYIDGVNLVNDSSYSSKAYLIAHIAREIDGGLRDILAPDEVKAEFQKTLKVEEEHKKIKGHVASILVALDSDKDKPLTTEYINVATNFINFVHRSGAYKKPRDPQEIINLWNRYEDVLFKLFGDYINQLKHLDRIIKFPSPTNYILETLPNFFVEDSKKIFFYENLKNVNWFLPLYTSGFFDPETINLTQDNKFWSQITYLTFVSEEIKNKRFKSENSKYILEIIYKISTSEKYENYSDDIRLWYFLFKILSNIPKSYLNKNFLDIFPKFFNSKHDVTLTGRGLVEFVKSYFLEEEITNDGKEIIEQLLIFALELTDDKRFQDSSPNEEENIFPKVQTYILKDLSTSKDFCKHLAFYCSNKLLIHIADKLESYLSNNYYSDIKRNSIFFERENEYDEYNIDVIYVDFFKNIIISIEDSNRIREITSVLLSSRYKHFYMYKIAYYIMSLHWGCTKDLFISLIENLDDKKCFSDWDNADELYFLLEKISIKLDTKECKYIEEIINLGSQKQYFYDNYPDDFKLYWFSALKDSTFFTKKFEKLSIELNQTYESLKPKMHRFITWGSSSPYTKSDLLKFEPCELVNEIKRFDPKRSFQSASPDGLANVLEEFFAENPKIFTDNFKLYLKVQFIYSTKILYGISKYLEENKIVDWKNIIQFIFEYSLQLEFKEDNLKLKNDNIGYNKNSFIAVSCRLLSKGNSNEYLYDKSLIPIVNDIFDNFLNYIEFKICNLKETDKLRSLTYFINSNNGIILESYFYFILRKAKELNRGSNDKSSKWTVKEKEYFNRLDDENCEEFFMLLSYKKAQFLFIDYDWTMEKIRSIPQKRIESVKAFFGIQVTIADPTGLDYEIFQETYRTAISENWEFDTLLMANSLERHLGVFYLFEYENLEKDGLLDVFFKSKRVDKIGNLIHFFSHYVKPYVVTLKKKKQKIINSRILVLWEKCFIVLEEMKAENAYKEISGLIHFLQFVDEINDENFDLINKTSSICAKHWEMDSLLKYLNNIKHKGEPIKIGNNLIEILNNAVFKDIYYLKEDKKDILEILEHLYKLNDEVIKRKVNNICNDFAKKGVYFTNDLYEKFN